MLPGLTRATLWHQLMVTDDVDPFLFATALALPGLARMASATPFNPLALVARFSRTYLH